MSQNSVDFSIDPSGDQLLDTLLTGLQQNINTLNSGTSRPSFAVAGTLWLNTTTNPWVLNVFDGTDDISLGTVNTSTNVFTPPAASYASGISTFLTTPSSANLRSAVTDETGSGALVFATSPTLVTPLLGTPTSGTLTNCTGLPLSGLAQSSATTGQVPTWNGSGWVAATPAGGTDLTGRNILAWVNFNGTGTVAIRDSYNVSSITDNGTGDYTINFTSNVANANYATIVTAGMTGTGAANQCWGAYKQASAAVGSVGVRTGNGGGFLDSDNISVLIIGD